MRFAARLSLVMLLSLGLVFPRVSVALAGLAGGARTVVLCDGVGLVTLVLDAQGRPSQVKTGHDPCGMAHAADPGPAAPLALWRPAVLTADRAAPARVAVLPPAGPRPQEPRAPPAA